jgi:hypothetical protein
VSIKLSWILVAIAKEATRRQLVDGNPVEWGNYIVRTLLAERVEPDGTITPWSPPHTPCWHAPVGLGRHEATFQFRQTSGDIQSYTWYFEIVE